MNETETGAPEGVPSEASPAERRVEELSRALAEVINDREAFKRRLERERDRQVQAERAETARVLFDAVDELERALAAGEGNAGALAHGVRMIAADLQRRIEGLGITRIEAAGERFDPELHEALDVVPVRDPEGDGRVVDELRSGWRAGERVIRPAHVRVGRHAGGPA